MLDEAHRNGLSVLVGLESFLYIGRFLSGLFVGINLTVVPVYIMEMIPNDMVIQAYIIGMLLLLFGAGS